MKKIILMLSLIFCCSIAFADELQTNTPSGSVSPNEVFQLVISTDQQVPGNLDVTPLAQDFKIVGTARSERLIVSDNKTFGHTEWVISLVPRRTGNITIPALKAGKLETKPRTISVGVTAPSETPRIQNFLHDELVLPPAIVAKSTVDLGITQKLFWMVLGVVLTLIGVFVAYWLKNGSRHLRR